MIAATKLRASRYATESRSQSKDPRTAHEAGLSAERCALEVKKLEKHLSENVEMVVQITLISEFIEISESKSPLRALAFSHLQDAAMLLRREIGDEPTQLNPTSAPLCDLCSSAVKNS